MVLSGSFCVGGCLDGWVHELESGKLAVGWLKVGSNISINNLIS